MWLNPFWNLWFYYKFNGIYGQIIKVYAHQKSYSAINLKNRFLVTWRENAIGIKKRDSSSHGGKTQLALRKEIPRHYVPSERQACTCEGGKIKGCVLRNPLFSHFPNEEPVFPNISGNQRFSKMEESLFSFTLSPVFFGE